MPDAPVVSVVIPARNEERLLPAALAAITRSCGAVSGAQVDVIVVADSCTDRTAEVAVAGGARVIEIDAANVGEARRTGMQAALDRHGHRGHWLASTDADSAVPSRWLASHLAAARRGFDLLLGTVRLTPGDEAAFPTWVRRYLSDATRGHQHGHIHGANLGISAALYRTIGGFGPLHTGEDVDLVHRARAIGARISWDVDVPVVTSSRLTARAPLGVAADLANSRG